MAGMTEVSAALACAAAWRCSCCSSDLAAAAASRSLILRSRRACADEAANEQANHECPPLAR
jgi:hypothetical protein